MNEQGADRCTAVAPSVAEEWRADRERYQAIMDNCTAVIYLKDLGGRYLFINRRYETLFHVSRHAILGKTDFEVFPAEHAAAFRANDLKVLDAGEPMEWEEVAPHDDGPHHYVSLKFPMRDATGTIYGVCGISSDITPRKEAEQRLAESAAELHRTAAAERAATQQLRKAQSQLVHAEKMVALGQMVAGVAHEINNPLSYVSNNMAVLERDLTALRELLARYQDAERALGRPEAFQNVAAYAAEIDAPYTLANLDGILARSKDGLKRIQQIVRDLREFARDSDKDWHEVDVNAGIESTLHIIKLRATRKKVLIETDLDLLPRVQCHPARINQVVLNLVSNAIDACQEGGRVIVRSRRAGPNVEIHVIDNGSGIDPAIRAKIFDPFFTTKPPGMGTGLGLSISHSIMEDHQGRIELESEPGAGAHFTIVLPLRAGKA